MRFKLFNVHIPILPSRSCLKILFFFRRYKRRNTLTNKHPTANRHHTNSRWKYEKYTAPRKIHEFFFQQEIHIVWRRPIHSEICQSGLYSCIFMFCSPVYPKNPHMYLHLVILYRKREFYFTFEFRAGFCKRTNICCHVRVSKYFGCALFQFFSFYSL